MIPIMTHEFEGYHHTRYHPFWQACEALEIIVHFHSGGSNMHQYFGDNWPAEPADDYVGGMGVDVADEPGPDRDRGVGRGRWSLGSGASGGCCHAEEQRQREGSAHGFFLVLRGCVLHIVNCGKGNW